MNVAYNKNYKSLHFLIKQETTKTLNNCNISDNKRQQTITVDYKRLFNGLLLTDSVSLQRNN
jgi:hypothetical protein